MRIAEFSVSCVVIKLIRTTEDTEEHMSVAAKTRVLARASTRVSIARPEGRALLCVLRENLCVLCG